MNEKTTNGRRRVDFDSMHLQVGHRLQLSVVRDVKPIQYFSSLIGYIRNDYMILKAPVVARGVIPFREGDKVSVRVFSGVSVCTFDVVVNRIFGAPLFYMHVSFPDAIFGIGLRTAMRVKVNIPAKLSKPQAPDISDIQVHIENISVGGALLGTPLEIGKEGEEIQLRFHMDSETEGNGTDILAHAIIRNVGTRQPEAQDATPTHLFGVQFDRLDPTQQLMLQNLTYQAVLEDRQKIV
jgi:c-di-GMP-binding flagellar brake protein YcgR